MRAWTRAGLVGAAAGAAAAVVAPARADACVRPVQWLYDRSVIPRDGATDVPRNVQVRAAYHGDLLYTAGLALRPLGGEPVAATRTSIGMVFELAPAELLAPSTTYELLDEVLVPCDSSIGDTIGCGVEPHVIATFTTGEALDVTPPTFGGLRSIRNASAFEGTECDNGRDYILDLTWSPATDDGAADAIRYNVYSLRGGMHRVAQVATSDAHVTAFCDLDDLYPNDGSDSIDAPAGEFVVRAVDAAGNEDGNDRRAASILCYGGCAASGGSGRGVLGAIALLGLSALRRRRS